MQIWKDLSTGKFFTLNLIQGTQSPSNRFGSLPSKFIPYTSGYPRTLSLTPIASDPIYSVQPSKFDGYSQFPRPLMRPAHFSLESHKNSPSNIHKPLNHLTLSAVYDKTITPPKLRFKQKSVDLWTGSFTEEIERLKNSHRGLEKEVKTVNQMSKKLLRDKEIFKPYVKKESREERRRLKGYFMKEFLTGGELYEKERCVVKKTNRVFFERLEKMEEMDRKNLQKRRVQKLAVIRRDVT